MGQEPPRRTPAQHPGEAAAAPSSAPCTDSVKTTGATASDAAGTGAAATGAPFVDFTAAAQGVLATLQAHSGMQLWMITRVIDEQQIVLLAQDEPGDHTDGSGAARGHVPGRVPGQVPGQVGKVLAWDSSLCRAMVTGQGPTIAPDITQVPAYAAASNGRAAGVRAYVGVPLRRADGQLLGTLCAFDTRAQPQTLRHLEPHVHLKARLLATVLVLELQSLEHQRRTERAQLAAGLDALTALANRRTWDQALVREEARCRRYGHSACVVVLDLDGLKEVNDTRGHLAGDELLRSCAQQLRRHARRGDLIARLGGDEFAVLLIECSPAGGQRELARLRQALHTAGIAASAGLGVRDPGQGLTSAWQAADAAMYRDKHDRHERAAR